MPIGEQAPPMGRGISFYTALRVVHRLFREPRERFFRGDLLRSLRPSSRRVKSAAALADVAVKARPRTSAALGATLAGTGFLLASLYTEESDCEMREAGNLDSKVDAPQSQAHFGELMRDWTRAAALYSQARGCHRAQYALGRLCLRGPRVRLRPRIRHKPR